MDHRAFGRLEAQVEELEKRLDRLITSLDGLAKRLEHLESSLLAIQVKGSMALWVVMAVAGIMGWFADKIWGVYAR